MADPTTRLQPIDPRQECVEFEHFNATERPDGYLKPGWQRHYRAGAVLTHRVDLGFDPNDPFWIVITDQSTIRDHNDIEEPVFVDFVRQVYDDLVRLKEAEPCRTAPAAEPARDCPDHLNPPPCEARSAAVGATRSQAPTAF